MRVMIRDWEIITGTSMPIVSPISLSMVTGVSDSGGSSLLRIHLLKGKIALSLTGTSLLLLAVSYDIVCSRDYRA
jgi:hypothetical protein